MIPEGTTEKEILLLLQEYGDITEFVIIRNGDKQTKGYGFCHYSTRREAIQAIRGMNGKIYLHVIVIYFFDNPRGHQLHWW